MDNEDWLDPIFDSVVSEIQRSGYFDRVNDNEMKSKPGRGITAAVWVQSMMPIAGISGLASTGCRVVFQLRGFSNMLKDIAGKPELNDGVDRRLVKAMSNLSRRFHGDFDFEGVIRNVDLLGHWGISLSVTAGYLEQDKVWYRTMDMLIPCIVNDVWPQVDMP